MYRHTSAGLELSNPVCCDCGRELTAEQAQAIRNLVAGGVHAAVKSGRCDKCYTLIKPENKKKKVTKAKKNTY